MLLTLLAIFPATSQAQASIEMGAAFQRVNAYQRAFDFRGYSFDLSVRTSRKTNLIFRFQQVSHDNDGPLDPMTISSLEAGFQVVPMRGRQLQFAFGAGLGAFVRGEYDGGTSGASLFAQARMSWYPDQAVGVYVEALGRSFAGFRGGEAVGLTLGVSLGVNH